MNDQITENTDPVYHQQISNAIRCIGNQDLDGAADACGAALQRNSERHEVYFLFAVVAYLVNDLGRALEMANKGHEINPNCAEGCDILAHIHAYAGNLNDSVFFGKLATAGDSCPVLSTLDVEGLNDLAKAMDDADRVSYKVEALRAYYAENYDLCVASCEKEMRLNNGDAELFEIYGRGLLKLGLFSRGIAALHGASHLNPENPMVYARLGEGYVLRGERELAKTCFETALELSGNSNSILSIASQYAHLLPKPWKTFDSAMKSWLKGVTPEPADEESAAEEKDKIKNIQIGLLIDRACSSEEFRYLEPWFWEIDRGQFDLHVYSLDRPDDDVPAKLKGLSETWVDMSDVNEKTLITVMKARKLDVLIDVRVGELDKLSSVVMAHPAKKVVAWNLLNEGMRAHGYDTVLHDGALKPKKSAAGGFAQSLAAAPVISSDGLPRIEGMSPVQTLKHITFGALCDLSKVTPDVAKVWSRLLHQVPGSRLLLGNVGQIPQEVKSRFQEMFSTFGCVGHIDFAPLNSTAPLEILLSRLEFMVSTDVYLDSFPTGGGVELSDALWSGVPVIGHCGSEQMGSLGNALLRAAGQEHWIAKTDKAYVSLGVEAAEKVTNDPAWRSTMHENVRNSRLFDTANWGQELNAMIGELAGG